MSARYWVKRILIPVVIGAVVSATIGLIPRLFMAPSFGRIVVVVLLCDATFIMLAWSVLLDVDEREFLKRRVGLMYRNFKDRIK